MRWTAEALNATVDAEIEALPGDMRARLARLSAIVEEHGLGGLPRDAVKHLDGRLWELRITGRDGISRAIYVTAAVRRVVIVRVFVKERRRCRRANWNWNWRGSGRRRCHDEDQHAA